MHAAGLAILPFSAYLTGRFRIKSNQTACIMKHALTTLAAATVLTLAVFSSSCNKATGPWTDPSIPTDATDLSAAGTANCYIVSPGSVSVLDASVKGNSAEPVGEVASAELVWQSAKGLVKELEYSSIEKGIVVQTSSMAGNALVAATDADGNILWSWHLWIQPDISLVRFGDYTLMDRNLGATYCPGTGENYNAADRFAGYGFCYQWGRKDPFFQPETDDTSNGGKSQPWYEKTNGSWNLRHENHIGQQKTIPESVKSPLDFCAANENRWQTTYPNGDGQINDLWGYVGMTGFQGSSFAKTMYDPCPPGYRVMQHDVFMSGHICAADHDLQFSFNKENDYGIYLYNGLTITQRTNDNDYNNQYGGWVGKQTAASAGGIWFPNARAMNSNGLYNSSNSYRLSSATPFSGESSREIRWWDNYGEYRIQQNHGNDQNWMSDGRVVRCQME